MMGDLQSWLNTVSQVAIGAGVLYGLWRMIQITRMAREARERGLAASLRAEAAAEAAAASVVEMGADLKELKVHTNSIKDALIASTAKASKLEGKEEQRVEDGKT